MGRAKLNMELIPKEKSRNVTYKKRKDGLIRKMHEFTTLCDVSACMIIYGPKQHDRVDGEPEIWPQDPNEVRRVIEIYQAKSKDSGHKSFGLPDFFQDRKRKIQDELIKLRKKNLEAKYPTWPDFMALMTEAHLREFAAGLAVKVGLVRSRIEQLRRIREMGSNPRPATGGVELEIAKPDMDHMGPGYYPAVDHQYHHHHHYQNSMMMVLMNENEQRMQFGLGGNVAAYKRQQIFYETMGADHVGMMGHNPLPLAQYYGPPVAVGPPHVQVAPTVQLPKREGNFGNEVDGDTIRDGDGGQVDMLNINHEFHMNYNRVNYYE